MKNAIAEYKSFLEDQLNTIQTHDLKFYTEKQREQNLRNSNKTNVNIKVIYTKSNQNIFTYNNGVDITNIATYSTASQLDPVLFVNSPEFICESWYFDLASTADLYLSDDINLDAFFQKSGADEYITSINDLYDSASNYLMQLENKQSMNYVAILLAFFIIIISNGLLAMIYIDKNKRIIFAKRSNGYSFISVHFKTVALMLTFSLLIFFTAFILGTIKSNTAYYACLLLTLVNPLVFALFVGQKDRKIIASDVKSA
jgi:hypothetical protein